MEIMSQSLALSEYNNALYIKNNIIAVDENSIICLMITNKNTITKNNIQSDDIDVKKFQDKKIIPYKDFKVFFDNGEKLNFSIFNNEELAQTLKKFKKFTQSVKPLLYDNFLESSPLIINSDNYCYIKKQYIEKVIVRNGRKDLGNEYYVNAEKSSLIVSQEVEGCINFKILEIDLGLNKVKMNMYLEKTLQYNEFHTPGLISVKQKIKKML